MTRCDLIERLLPQVADGEAGPAGAAQVGRHVESCTRCRILLARERRLSEAIAELGEIEVDALFTATVMQRLPARFPRRARDRRGLRLAVLGGLGAVLAAVAGAARPGWDAGLPTAAPPSLPADVAEPAAGGMIAVAQMVLMALQSIVEAPFFAAAPAAALLSILIAAGSLLIATAFGSTLVAFYVLGTRTHET